MAQRKHPIPKGRKEGLTKKSLTKERPKLSKANTNSCGSCLLKDLGWNSELQRPWEA